MDRLIEQMLNSQASRQLVLPPPIKTRRQRTKVKYEFVGRFDCLAQAKKFVKDKNEYNYNNDSHNESGRRLIYLCKESRRCPSRLSIWMANDRPTVDVMISSAVHDHSHACHHNPTYGIDTPTKMEIERIFSLGVVKPKEIHEHLMTMPQLDMPKKTQLYHFIKHLKNQQNSNRKLDIDQDLFKSNETHNQSNRSFHKNKRKSSCPRKYTKSL